MRPEGQRLEALAERLRGVDPVLPSPAGKIRGWNLVAAAVEHSAARRPRGRPAWRLTLAAAAAGVLLALGAVSASANSLPDSPFYPIKGALEQVRGDLAFSPSDRLGFHLDLAQARLTEAEAMIARHRIDLADQALVSMDEQFQEAADVVAAERRAGPALAADLQHRLQQAIESHDRQLAGLQGEVSNPTAQQAIVRARDRAAQVLEGVANNAGNGNPGGNAAGKSQGQGQAQGSGKGSPTAHPTPKK
ncbi:MAG: hypothetical protein E6I88_02940 [Chloroflexi bacterium]|nr:MAG: hypothetical protein E6I88_02940 [Chloroflexota bacterium]TME47661.1 MAG: hypothetical protein E6I56_03420 [Chloroflexota bacterium]